MIQQNSEEWRAVPGYEGWYSVSSTGDVRRDCTGPSTRSGRILKPWVDRKGYQRLNLLRHGERARIKVHLVVALVFLGPRPPGYEVNHKNGIKTDNGAANLEYVTHDGNRQHAIGLGLIRVTGRPQPVWKNPTGPHLTTTEVAEIKSRLLRGEKQRLIAADFGVCKSTVRHISTGRHWAGVASAV